jgi:hypothetical protein
MSIEDIISKTHELHGRGRFLRSVDHDSLVVDRQRQLFFWNSRGIFGNSVDWLVKVMGVNIQEAKNAVANKEDDLFSGVYTTHKKNDVKPDSDLVEVFYLRGKGHREYWYDVRGYTQETVERFRLGYTGKLYTIPIYVDGHFKNLQCLRHKPKGRFAWYKGLGALPFNFSMLKFTDWVVLTEGPVDAIMLRQNNIPAVSQTGGAGTWSNQWLHYFIGIKEIFVTYDNDEAGNKGAKRVAKNLGLDRTRIYNYWDFADEFDTSDFFKKGTRDEFLETIRGKAVTAWRVP